MSFVHPSYLWALLGIAVPIAIHLWSKKEAKTVKIGSVQLLSASKSKQSSSIQMTEWWLLLIRMLVISLLVFLMAKPRWNKKVVNTEITFFVEPSLVKDAVFMKVLDSLTAEKEVRYLAKDFPLYDAGEEVKVEDKIPNYWQLASEMATLKTDSIVVFTKGFQEGLKGMRPQTGKNISWVVLDRVNTLEKPLLAYQRGESLDLVSIISNSNLTQFTKQDIDLENPMFTLNSNADSLQVNLEDKWAKVPVKQINPIQIALFYTDSLKTEKKYIEAAFSAISNYTGRDITVESQSDTLQAAIDNPDLTIWLSEKPSPVSFQKLLLFKQDSLAEGLIEDGEMEMTFVLTERLNTENSVSLRLTENLLFLLGLESELNQMVPKWDIRNVSEALLKTNHVAQEKKKAKLAGIEISTELWVVLLFLLLAERMLAFKRKH